jgi:hypothetical protein
LPAPPVNNDNTVPLSFFKNLGVPILKQTLFSIFELTLSLYWNEGPGIK